MYNAASASNPDALLLIAFLNGCPKGRKKFLAKYRPILPKRAEHLMGLYYPHLSKDLADDVAQRAWELILSKKPENFDSKNGKVNGFLKGMLKTALRDINADYVRPLHRTREESAEAKAKKAAANDGKADFRPTLVYIDAVAAGGSQGDIADPYDPIAAAFNRIGVEMLLEQIYKIAPRPVFCTLKRVYTEGLSIPEASVSAGASRTTIERHIKKMVARLDFAQAA